MGKGGNRSHHGRHFTVENARLYSLPETPPPSADLAGRLGDGMIVIGPEASLFVAFDRAGGAGKSRYGELTGC